ncbi:DEAD/DEAH box helicase family protein, partial [Nevskia ramosa]|uniref:DEAD/DEAH box helicase family protein n=1 Tax=Nevskia ramosa TaxID=64002 RepID=UPI00235510A4
MFRTRSVPLPSSVVASLKAQGKGVSNRIAALIHEEAARDRPLQPLDRANIEYVPVRVDTSLLETVKSVKSRFPEIACSEGEVIGRLVMTALKGSPMPVEKPAPPSTSGCGFIDIGSGICASRFTLRQEQIDLCGHLERASATGKVALLESATGTGKGLVIAAAAAAMARSGFRTLICAPSHQVNAQIRRHFADADVQAGDHAPVSVFGRVQFYSPSLLAFMLESGIVSAENETPVRALLDRDLDRYSQGSRSSVFHLEDLRAVWPHHSHLEAALLPQIDDEANTVYEQQFEAARAARIVLATHSMVALDFNVRRMNAVRDLGFVKEESIDEEAARLVTHAFDGILGRFDALLVDEAHLFEPNVAAAMSDSVSVYMTKSRIERYGSREATQLARKSYDTLAKLGSGSEDLVLKQGVGTDEQTALRTALADLKTAITLSVKKRSMPSDVKATLVKTADTIGRALTLRNQLSTLRFSPTQRYPRLMTGPASVARIVADFWQSASWGAALSATLYTRDMSGNANAGFMSRRLRIPMGRLLTHTPMVPSWTVSPVTLIRSPVPEGDLKQHPMFPPAAHDADDEAVSSGYFDALSAAINHAVSDALGGALVLCTSYQA